MNKVENVRIELMHLSVVVQLDLQVDFVHVHIYSFFVCLSVTAVASVYESRCLEKLSISQLIFLHHAKSVRVHSHNFGNCCVANEGLVKVTGSHIHCRSDYVSKTVRHRDVVSLDHK